MSAVRAALAVTLRRWGAERVAPVEAARARARRRLRVAVPAPLAALLVAVAAFGVIWALVVPAWQSPDEDIHFAYVQSLVERGARPGDGPNPVSTAQLGSMHATNTDATALLTTAQPQWSQPAFERWKRETRTQSQSDGGGSTPAASYPPGYYALEAPAYLLAGPHADVLTRLYAARLGSVLWLLLTTAGAWLLAGELTGRRRLLQLLTAACVGLWPMLDYLSASVNPDALLYAATTWSLWLGVRLLRRGLTVGRGLALCAAIGVALAAKATSLALLPATAFALLYGAWRLLPAHRRRLGAIAGLVALVVAPVVVWRLGLAFSAQASYVSGQRHHNVREFLSYLWQYYLPRLPFQTDQRLDIHTISGYPAYNVWVATGWAAFGWVTVFFPKGVYPWFLGITVAVGAGAAARGGALLRAHRGDGSLRTVVAPIAVFFALAFGCLLIGLHYTEYKLHAPTNQGRYLFPFAALAGSAVALALGVLPRRWRPAGAGVVLALLVVFQVACLGLVASHWYG